MNEFSSELERLVSSYAKTQSPADQLQDLLREKERRQLLRHWVSEWCHGIVGKSEGKSARGQLLLRELGLHRMAVLPLSRHVSTQWLLVSSSVECTPTRQRNITIHCMYYC